MKYVYTIIVISTILLIYLYFKNLEENKLIIDGLWIVDTEFAKKADIKELQIVFDTNTNTVFIHLVNINNEIIVSDKFKYTLSEDCLNISNCSIFPLHLTVLLDKMNNRIELYDNSEKTTYAVLFKDSQGSFYINKRNMSQLDINSGTLNINTNDCADTDKISNS
jgi:hypothetical protein